MSRYRDAAPVGLTCPKIDEVICFIENIDSENISLGAIKNVILIMEEIRTANHTLREWGNDLNNKVQESEYEIDEKTREIDKLNDEIDEKTREIDKLNDEIFELKEKIKYLKLELSESVLQIDV